MVAYLFWSIAFCLNIYAIRPFLTKASSKYSLTAVDSFVYTPYLYSPAGVFGEILSKSVEEVE